MKIEKLIPTGFCYGVMHSYESTLDIIKRNQDKKIYMLGWLVHNKYVIEQLLNFGVIILDDKNISRYRIIDQFDHVNNAILILSAHGTDQETINLAKQKGFEVFDLTCRYVYKTHDIIKQKIIDGYNILFVGKLNHPETNAILKINKDIKLISSIDEVRKYKLYGEKIFCTNQTTFNIKTLEEINSAIMTINPNIEFQNEICNATKMRQKSIQNISATVDICLIIGDIKSSNANEMYQIAKNEINTYFISNINDIELSWFKNKKHCALAGAASTPIFLIDEIYNFLIKHIN